MSFRAESRPGAGAEAEGKGRIAELEARLAESEERLGALQRAEVDAVLVSRPEGDLVFTLRGAESIYRFLVEEMSEGALLIGSDATILYANSRFAELAGTSLQQVIGSYWHRFFEPLDQLRLARLLTAARTGAVREELSLLCGSGPARPVAVSLCLLKRKEVEAFSVVVTDLTERKAAETALCQANESLERRVVERTRELAESEERFRAIFDQAGLGIAQADAQGRFLVVNDRWCEITGYSREELLAITVRQLTHPEDRAETDRLIADLTSGRTRRISYEKRYLRGSGGHVPVRVTVTAIRAPDGQFLYGIAVLEDITERKAAEQALARATARYNGIISSAMDAVISVDARHRIVIFNPAAEKMFGLSLSQAVGQEINRLIPQRFHAQHTRNIQRFGSTGVTSRHMGELGTVSGVRANGEEFPLEASISQIQLGEERLFTVILRDVTQRVRTEHQLQLQSVALQSAANAILITDRDGTIEWVNEAFTHLTGYAAAEAIGRNPRLLNSGKQEEAFYRALWETLAAGRIWRGELVNQRKDGQLYTAELTIAPVLNQDGTIGHFVGIEQDVTELVAARDLMARSKEQLERLVAERTASLRETVDELERFSYSLTHDLRAPLRAMHTYAMVLEEESAGKLPPQASEYLRRIKLAAGRMDQLIQDSLDYNQVVRQNLPRVPVELGKLLHGLLETYPNLQAPAAEIDLQVGQLLVLGNEAALTQIFSNLLGNAVKFVAPGVKPRVRVWAELRVAQKQADREKRVSASPHLRVSASSALIWIEDNGIGIPRDAQEKIFGMFQRLHHEREYPGTGIGLAIVRKALHRIGGEVCIDSEPGRGSRFCVELALATSGQTPQVLPIPTTQHLSYDRPMHPPD